MLQFEKKRGIDCSLIDKIRKRIFEILQDDNEVDTCDVSRLEKDDSLIICFIAQYFGNHDTRDDRKETEGIVRICKHLLETLKWRKAFGINQLKVTDFPTVTITWNVGLLATETVKDNTKVVVWRANKFKSCVAEFGGIEYVPTILGGMNPIRGLIPLPDQTVTIRELGPKLGLNEKQIQEWEVYVAQTSKKMHLEDHLFA